MRLPEYFSNTVIIATVYINNVSAHNRKSTFVISSPCNLASFIGAFIIEIILSSQRKGEKEGEGEREEPPNFLREIGHRALRMESQELKESAKRSEAANNCTIIIPHRKRFSLSKSRRHKVHARKPLYYETAGKIPKEEDG